MTEKEEAEIDRAGTALGVVLGFGFVIGLIALCIWVFSSPLPPGVKVGNGLPWCSQVSSPR